MVAVVQRQVLAAPVIAGIDYSTHAVDIVLLDEDSDAATWRRVPLVGQDAFERARDVPGAMWQFGSDIWDDVLAIGIEDPRGYGAGALYRVQGAILAKLPAKILVHPLIPSHWRKTVGLPGNATKAAVQRHVIDYLPDLPADRWDWPQDACDAYCIALATRTLLQHGESAPNLGVESEQAARPSRGDGPMAEPDSQLSTSEIA